jgi:hypothetical protein
MVMLHRIGVSEKRRRGQKGNSLIEFGLMMLFLVPLFMGMTTFGIGLGKMIQASQICRDAGHMFVRQVDFSQTQNKKLIERLAVGMNMTVSGGNGTVVLTQVLMIGPDECAGGGLSTAECTNLGFPVITQQIVIGNPALFPSSIGTPPGNYLQADGTILPDKYLKEASCRAGTLSNANNTGLLTLQNSERTYVSEAYFKAPELAFLNRGVPMQLSARNYF